MKRRLAKLRDWRPHVKNSLRGLAKVQFSSGIVTVAGSRAWAAPPSRPWLKDGTHVLDDRGKPKWQPLLEFATHGVLSSWSRQVLAALRAKHPEVFADAEDAA